MLTHFLNYPPAVDDPSAREPCVLALGVFDGVHLGHRAVIGRALALAHARALPVAVLTFVEHPRTVLRPDQPVPLLSTWREKRDLIADLGATRVIGAHFTPQLAQMEAETFVREIVREHLAAAHVVVGWNFRFGHQAAGGPDLLESLAGTLGFGCEVVPPFQLDGAPVSSSEIRRLLAAGDMEAANRLLGHPYGLSGMVVGGEQRGGRIGFPTANLHVDERKLLPHHGVYAGVATWVAGRRPASVNIGFRPTFDSARLEVEAHLLDFKGDLYGQQLSLHLEYRLRPEIAFPSPGHLVEQIRADVDRTRSLYVTTEVEGR